MGQVALLRKYGLSVQGFRGQHLLIDPNIQRKIIEVVDPRPGEWILEIGPGLGALTTEILARGARVIAVEKDRRFCEILEKELGGDYKGKLKIVNTDILKADLGKLMQSTPSPLPSPPERGRGEGEGDKIKAVSNLPYYITSPVFFWLIANRSHIKSAVLMMQKEVANRLLAQPGDKDYGRFTLAVRYYAQVHRAFDVSRNCFTPRPEVDSSVLTLVFYPSSKLPKGLDENLLFHIVKVAFGARRKMLLSRLAHDPQIGKSRVELLKVFQTLRIPENARAEDLLLKDFISLSRSLFSPSP